jgi:hypothetical protein
MCLDLTNQLEQVTKCELDTHVSIEGLKDEVDELKQMLKDTGITRRQRRQ